MSVVLYKDGESGVFEVKQMAGLLNGGWSTEVAKDVVQKENEEESKETPEDVRLVAKDAGIEGWENKRIKTLKAELNEQQT